MKATLRLLTIAVALLASITVRSQGSQPVTQYWLITIGASYQADYGPLTNFPCPNGFIQGSGSNQTIASLEAQAMPAILACLPLINQQLMTAITNDAQSPHARDDVRERRV
jgi:hypothetical protein